jgi:hypothetical protein
MNDFQISPQPAGHHLFSNLKLRVSSIVWFLLATTFLLSVPVLSDWSGWLIIIFAIIALVIAWPITWILRHLFAGQRNETYRAGFVKAALASLFVLCTVTAAPLYYLAAVTEAKPLIAPQATLSNGNKTIVFQGMMHIGSEGFYKSVVYDLERSLADSYVIYYEGVMPSTPEGNAWFSKTLGGGGDLNTNYKALAGTCGLHFQLDYFDMLRGDMVAHPERHITADVTTAQMQQEYEHLLATDPAFAADAQKTAAIPEGTDDKITSFINWQKKGTEGQKRLAGVVCRGVATIMLGGTSKRSQMDKVLLDFRNRELVKRILNERSDKIYITYGAEHLPGVVALLQKADPKWAIKTLKWVRTVETPETLDGQLK